MLCCHLVVAGELGKESVIGIIIDARECRGTVRAVADRRKNASKMTALISHQTYVERLLVCG